MKEKRKRIKASHEKKNRRTNQNVVSHKVIFAFFWQHVQEKRHYKRIALTKQIYALQNGMVASYFTCS